MLNLRQLFKNVWITVDQAANTILLGAPDETVSGRLGRYKNSKGWRRVVGRPLAAVVDLSAWVLFRDKNHCENTWKYEQSIIHRPESFDDKPGD